MEERRAISHSFGEDGPAGYVVLEQFLRDVVRSVLDTLVAELRKSERKAKIEPADGPKLAARVRKRPDGTT